MAPTPYHRSFSFTGSAAANPNFVPAAYGSANDSELDQIANVTTAIIASLGLIQRSDGALQNGIVTLDSLAPAILLTFQNDIAASAANAAAAATSANGAAAAVGAAAASAASAASSAAGAASAVTNAAANAVAAASASATAAAGSASNASTSAAAAAASAAQASSTAIPAGSITGDKLVAGAIGDQQVSSVGSGKISNFVSGGVGRTLGARAGDLLSVADFANFATAVAVAGTRRLWVPAGAYPIGANLTVSCDLIFDNGAVINVANGVTLTLMGNIDAPMRTIFGFTGNVVFPRGCLTPRVPVEWFGARDPNYNGNGLGDAPFVQRALNACRAGSVYPGVPVYFSANTYSFASGNSGVTIYPDNTVYSEPNAHIEGPGNTAGGSLITLATGNYNTKLVLPSLATSLVGLTLDRANLANVEMAYVQNVTNGLVMNISGPANGGTGYNLLDNKVTIHVITQYSQNAILFQASQSGDTAQGNEVYVNFITNGLRATLFFDGGNNNAVNWDSNKVIIQAVDGTNFGAGGAVGTGAQGLTNAAKAPVARLIWHVETWFGGIPDSGGFVSGPFYFSQFELGMNDQIKYYYRMAITGGGNRIRTRDKGNDAAQLSVFGSSPAQGSFNGGAPVNTPSMAVAFASTSVPAGGLTKGYCYNPFVKTGSNVPRVTPINGDGFVLWAVATTNVDTEISITLLNVYGQTNTFGSTWRVECGDQ